MSKADNTPQPILELITRFLEGNASEIDLINLENWLKESPDNRRYFDELNNTYQASVSLNRFSQNKIDEGWHKLSQHMSNEPVTLRVLSSKQRHFTFLKIAASILAVAIVGFWSIRLLQYNTVPAQATLVRNAEGNNTRIVLPDNSVVWLNSNSQLEYPPTFGNTTREVSLKGEAFFDVKKGSKPFIVKTGKVQVHVKGTRFNVQAYKDEDSVKTTLEEGRVELHIKGRESFFVMNPGDQITLNTKADDVIRRKVNPSNFSAWKEERLVFNNTPLGDIAARVGNRYKVKISVTPGLVYRERLTMTIEHETLDEVLEMISLSSRLKVKKENGEIILFE
jgi:ferric-dicitrate binding protein FerR (iron transport regulator)